MGIVDLKAMDRRAIGERGIGGLTVSARANSDDGPPPLKPTATSAAIWPQVCVAP